jgi:tripartite-type tricarboxylate transporter receptor subunit TctC
MKIFKFLALALLACSAHAWEPTKPIKVIVANGQGGGNETSFRVLSNIVSKNNPNANFVLEYRQGADGVIGSNFFSETAPDGYTISLPSLQGQFVTGEIWFKDIITHKPMDWELVTIMAKSPLCIIANQKSTVNTVPELLSTLKNPNREINFAVGGAGHKLAYNFMLEKTNSNSDKLQSISYKGPAPALSAVASGDVEFGILPISVAKSLLDSGKIKLVALIGEQHLTGLPKTMLMKDYVPDMNVYAGWAITLPKNTPKEIVAWYETNFTQAITSEQAQSFFQNNLMFTDKKELGSKGSRTSILKLREQWQPIVRNMKHE